MRLLWSLILHMSIAAYAQNISRNEPDTPPVAYTTEGSLPSSTAENNATTADLLSQPTNIVENKNAEEVEQSPSCPDGYECYAEVFCENILPATDEKLNSTLLPCPLTSDVCCRKKEDEAVALKCGIRNRDGVGFRLISFHVEESKFGEFPWMALILSIVNHTESGSEVKMYQAGGSLIHPHVVLTVAHRVSGFPTNRLQVRLGEWDVTIVREIFPYQDLEVGQVLIHNDFDSANLRNDVALLFLTKPAELNEIVQPICLPPADANFDNRGCIATGWGKDVYGKTGTFNPILKKIELPIVPSAECQSLLRDTRLGKYFELHDSFLCAGGHAGIDTCNGDGGSPLVCPVDSSSNTQYYQVGMVAWGLGCGDSKTPAVYTNIAKFRKWIDQVITEKGLSTDRYTV